VEKIKLELYDLSGKQIQTLYSGSIAKGRGSISLHPNPKPAAGLYFINIKGRSFQQTLKCVIQ
jgi:hypothetical protein